MYSQIVFMNHTLYTSKYFTVVKEFKTEADEDEYLDKMINKNGIKLIGVHPLTKEEYDMYKIDKTHKNENEHC